MVMCVCVFTRRNLKNRILRNWSGSIVRACVYVGSIERDYVCKWKLYEYGDKSCMKL